MANGILPGMPPVSHEHFRHLLLEERGRLAAMAEGAREGARTVALDQNSMGRLSRMDALQGQAMAQENLRRCERRLLDVERALTALERGDYGRCIECDEDIAPQRLVFDPLLQRCIRCASAAE